MNTRYEIAKTGVASWTVYEFIGGEWIPVAKARTKSEAKRIVAYLMPSENS